MVLLGAAFAFSPQDALGYRSPQVNIAQAKLDAAKSKLTATQLGLSADLTTEYSNNSYYLLNVGWSKNSLSLLEALSAVETAELDLSAAKRNDQQAALVAHAGLWSAQAQLRAVEIRLEATEIRFSEISRKIELGALVASAKDDAQLALRQSELAVRQAKSAQQSAQRNADRLRLEGNAAGSPVLFLVTDVSTEKFPSYRRARMALAMAAARSRAAHNALWPTVSVGAKFSGDSTTMGTTIGLVGLEPNAGLNIGNRLIPKIPGASDWEFNLGAKITISPVGIASLEQADAELSAGEQSLLDTKNQSEEAFLQRKSDIGFALENLQLAKDRWALAQSQESISKIRLESGSISASDFLERQAATLDSAAGYAKAWEGYIAAQFGYLDLTDQQFEVMQ